MVDEKVGGTKVFVRMSVWRGLGLNGRVYEGGLQLIDLEPVAFTRLTGWVHI